MTAFSEGWAIHLEALAAHLAVGPDDYLLAQLEKARDFVQRRDSRGIRGRRGSRRMAQTLPCGAAARSEGTRLPGMMKLRKTWNEPVGADPAVLVSRLGPQVACEVKSVMVK